MALSACVANSVLADEPHILAAEYVLSVAELVGGDDHRHDGDGDLLVGPGQIAQLTRHRYALGSERQRMWRPDIVGLTRVLLRLARVGIAQAATVAENMERPRIAMLAITRAPLMLEPSPCPSDRHDALRGGILIPRSWTFSTSRAATLKGASTCSTRSEGMLPLSLRACWWCQQYQSGTPCRPARIW